MLFILSSCEQAEKSRYNQLVRSDQTLAFSLDDKTKNVTPFLSYYRDKKGKEYIVLQSYSMQSRNNKFYFYDKDSQELAFKIEPEIEAPEPTLSENIIKLQITDNHILSTMKSKSKSF